MSAVCSPPIRKILTKKMSQIYSIFHKGGLPKRGEGGGNEVGWNVKTFLNVEQKKKWPKTAEFIDKWQENIDLFEA